MTFYTLQIQNYLPRRDDMYEKVITISDNPNGPLKDFVKQVRRNDLSIWDRETMSNTSNNQYCMNSCMYVIKSFSNHNYNMCINEFPQLLTFLSQNGYKIDSSLSKLFMKNKNINNKDELLCYITYES
jgi:hypothetical protein